MIGRIEGIAGLTGFGHTEIRKSLDAGKISENVQQVIVKKKLERQRKKISPLYNSQGKLIEYDNSGRHLDIMR